MISAIISAPNTEIPLAASFRTLTSAELLTWIKPESITSCCLCSIPAYRSLLPRPLCRWRARLCSLLELGAERIMFSVDYPMDVAETGVRWLLDAPISNADRNKIAHENADRLFNLAPDRELQSSSTRA